ncbi:MAG: hypothetical protein ACI9TF_001930, partial [Paracrocinitomix sp.]
QVRSPLRCLLTIRPNHSVDGCNGAGKVFDRQVFVVPAGIAASRGTVVGN